MIRAPWKSRLVELAALEPVEQRFFLKEKEPAKFPEVGADFASDDDSFSAISRAQWDGKFSDIEIELVRSNTKVSVVAPLIWALAKSSETASQFLGLIKDYSNAEIPFNVNEPSFKVKKQFSASMFANSLYVIEQPITVFIGDKRICFSAPVYSPIPLPQELLNCKLTELRR